MFMKIEKNYKEVISEAESKKTKYGCVMLYMKPTKELIGLQDEINEDDVYSKLLDGKEDYGRTPDDEYHVTILYGSLESVTLDDVKGVISKVKTPTLKIGDISLFENDVFDVVKIDVVSDELSKLNVLIAEFPYETDYPDYHPHCTIAYVKPGEGKRIIEKFNSVDNIVLEPSHFIYSQINGVKSRIELNND